MFTLFIVLNRPVLFTIIRILGMGKTMGGCSRLVADPPISGYSKRPSLWESLVNRRIVLEC
jgi:hypothetical protein